MSYRSYKKVQDVIGSIGGLIGILIGIIGYIIKPIADLKMKVQIANKIFSFEPHSGNKCQ